VTSQTKRNLDYYGTVADGRDDYWRYMAAPRFRVRTVLRALRDAHPAAVLDVGCGNGALLRAIAGALPEAKLTGLDLSAAQIEANRAAAPEMAWYVGNVEGDALELPEQYDAIVSSEVIEHLANPQFFLENVHRVAMPNATFILSTQSGRVGETERHVGHLRHFTADELRAMLERSGWRVLRVWNTGFPFHDLSKWLANRVPDVSMHRFGERRYGPLERLTSLILRGLFLLNSRRRGAQLFAIARRA
jgi:SAM-dependent methyltransferase